MNKEDTKAKTLAEECLDKSPREIAASIGAGNPGSPDMEIKKVILDFKLQKEIIFTTLLVAGGSMFFSLITFVATNNQFEMQNRPYIGVTHLEKLDIYTGGILDVENIPDEKDSTKIRTVKALFEVNLYNFGNRPGYFDLSGPNSFFCIGGTSGYLMPQADIKLDCEREVGTPPPGRDLCGFYLNEKIELRYGKTQNDRNSYVTEVSRQDRANSPESDRLKLKAQSLPGCDRYIPWQIKSGT